MVKHERCLLTLLIAAAVGCGSTGGSTDDTVADAAEVDRDVAPTSTCDGSGERCVDDWGVDICPTDTGYPGDGLSICQPAAGTGMLFHYGPRDYDDPEEIEKYMLPAGGEDENCVFVETTNDKPVYLNSYHARMRPGSHHLIVTVVDSLDPGVELGEPVSCNQSGAIGSRWLLASQDPQLDIGTTGGDFDGAPAQPGDPDYAAGTKIPPRSILRIDMHYLNPTDQPILREAWLYVNEVAEEDVEVSVDMITFLQSSINVPPNTTGTTTGIGSCSAPTERYVGLVTGHFHENGTRFTIWATRDGKREKVYETFDWESPGNGVYMDRADNPPLGDPGAPWGADSGYLRLAPGDSLDWQCEFDNPTDEVVGRGDQGRDQMCNLFGFYYPSDGDVWTCGCVGELCAGI